MQNPIKKRNSETSSKASTSKKKIPSFSSLEQEENLENEFHSEKVNIKYKKVSRSKAQTSNKEEVLVSSKHSRRKKVSQKSSSDLKSKYPNLDEVKITKEVTDEKLRSNVRTESCVGHINVSNNDKFLVSTQESSSNYTEINSQGSLDQLKLKNWGLPKGILKKYEARGIKSMFPWQIECLSNERLIRGNRNLVYSAPTSAGKTLVSEILILKTILERRKKVIFILPFVSVVREKMFYFQDLLSDSGVRVEGFMGSIAPAGGFQSVHVAIATIEKANSLINRLLEEEELVSVGAVVIDELHLLGDPNRGYILELLLTKLKYITLRYDEINIQLIGMSATLPNLSMLADWLDAELYKTDFRPIPLDEQCKIETTIYNREFQVIRDLPLIPELENDTENIIQLCIETIEGGHSVLIFCPTKNWCEKLSLQTASAFLSIGRSDSPLGQILKTSLDATAISETLEQLKRTPTGLDAVLKNTVSFGVAFHHAGLTIDERDIIEGSFRTGSLKVLVATSTLSTGVNLPARRVIIRSPSFHGKPLDTLSYRQMIGRAGRMGKDTAGESILICKSNERTIAETLLTSSIDPIESCLEDSGPLMRSLLEAIASEIVRTPEELDSYIKCTFINLQEKGEGSISKTIKEAVQFLVANEFLTLQETEQEHLKRWSATALGKACLSASVPPKEGLFLFEELLKARKCLALDTELHVVYLVTPYNPGSQIGQIDWMVFLEMWSTMGEPERRVAKLVGVEERFLTSAVRGVVAPGKNLSIHRRFYTALALYDLVREIPLYKVCKKFGCCRGLLQSLQQSSSTYAGMITSFCKQLNWSCMELLVAQFQTRLQFGVSRDLMDLLRLPSLNGLRARSLYKEGITTVVDLAVANELDVERALHKALPFESEKEHNGESNFELARQNKVRTTFITGKDGLTARQAAVLLVKEARTLLQNELGVREVHWDLQMHENASITSNISLRNIPNTDHNSESTIKESNSNIIESTNIKDEVIEVEEVVQGTQGLINKTQNNSSNESNKKLSKSKKDINSSRNKRGLMIEITKPSQNNQDDKSTEADISKSSSKQSSNVDFVKENSTSNINLLSLSAKNVSTSQKSVYENIDKEIERGLEEALLNIEEDEIDKEFVKSPNLFDSECSAHNCSDLEKNVLGSLRLSDFELTNLTRKRSSGFTAANLINDQMQETFKNSEITNQRKSKKSGTVEMFSSGDFDVQFTMEKETNNLEINRMNANIEKADLEITNFDVSEFKTNSKENKINANKINLDEENIPGLSEICLSDFEFTAPQKINSSSAKNSSLKNTFSDIRGSEFELSNVPVFQEMSKKAEAEESSKKFETEKISKKIDEKEESNKNYFSGINVSDFEMTNINDTVILRESMTDFEKTIESKKSSEIKSGKTKGTEFLTGINPLEFELSKELTISKNKSEEKKSNENSVNKISNKENFQMGVSDVLLANISQSKLVLGDLPLIKSNINTNVLGITKTKLSSKTSRNCKSRSESISLWDEDSWDNVQIKEEKYATPDREKRSKTGGYNHGSGEISWKKNKTPNRDYKNAPRRLIEKRKYSGAEGSPIVSVETYKSRKLSIASIESDSDDMFTPPKKAKFSNKTLINSNVQKVFSNNSSNENINKIYSIKSGSSNLQTENPKAVLGEKSIRNSLDPQSSFDSLVFSDGESSTHYVKETKVSPVIEISSDTNIKTDIDYQKWKLTNIVTSKKMLTLLKQKLVKRSEIAFALDCEVFTKNTITIGAKIIGIGNNDEPKKSKSDKLVHGDKKICGAAISWGFHALYYIPLEDFPEIKVSLKERINFLAEVLSNSSMQVRCFLAKKTYKLLYQCCGIFPSCKFLDPIVADWILNSEEKEKNMSFLIAKYYPEGHGYYENRSAVEKNPQYTENNATKEALLTWYITEVLLKKIQEKSSSLLYTFKEVEMQLISILGRMELRGLGINISALHELSDVIKKEMSLLEEKAYFIAGKKFNFMSSTHVAQVNLNSNTYKALFLNCPNFKSHVFRSASKTQSLFIQQKFTHQFIDNFVSNYRTWTFHLFVSVLGLQKRKKTTTSKAVLEQCSHPISKLIMSWRKLSALQTKLVFPLLNDAVNSRIHGSHITHTVTGRISMHEPNLQNVPKDFSLENNTYAISIRMAFTPTVGNLMLSADYCQLELRILAHFSNDSLLRSIMKTEGIDIFKSISAKWNNITEEMVDDKMRQRTKQLCYGMIYGMGTKSLAESLSVTESEAKEFLETFMRTYKGIRSWLSNVVERARVDGYVTTLAKRCRTLPGLWSENRSEKSQAERQAINTKIQGSAADIAKKAMILIEEKLQKEFSTTHPIFPHSKSKRRLRSSGASLEFRGAYLVLQLHDELLFEVNASDLHLVAGLVKESMEKAYTLEVPLPVKLKVGPAWGDLKEYT